jgi:hypothetical protein
MVSNPEERTDEVINEIPARDPCVTPNEKALPVQLEYELILKLIGTPEGTCSVLVGTVHYQTVGPNLNYGQNE